MNAFKPKYGKLSAVLVAGMRNGFCLGMVSYSKWQVRGKSPTCKTSGCDESDLEKQRQHVIFIKGAMFEGSAALPWMGNEFCRSGCLALWYDFPRKWGNLEFWGNLEGERIIFHWWAPLLTDEKWYISSPIPLSVAYQATHRENRSDNNRNNNPRPHYF